jgi:hypothetical protein
MPSIGRIQPPAIELTPEQSNDQEFLARVLVTVNRHIEELEAIGVTFPADTDLDWTFHETS